MAERISTTDRDKMAQEGIDAARKRLNEAQRSDQMRKFHEDERRRKEADALEERAHNIRSTPFEYPKDSNDIGPFGQKGK